MIKFSGILQATVVGSLNSVVVVVFTPQESADTTDTTNQLHPTQPVYHPLLWEETAASRVVTAMTGKLVLCITEERSAVLRDLVTERLDLVQEVRESSLSK